MTTVWTNKSLGTLVPVADITSETGVSGKVPKGNALGNVDHSWGGGADSLATLDGSARVVEDPANAAWVVNPFVAGDFTGSGSMTWTVAAGDVVHFRYMILGNIMVVEVEVSLTTVGGTPSAALNIKIPASKTALYGRKIPVYASDNGTIEIAYCSVSGTSLSFYRVSGSNWSAATNTTGIACSVMFEIA